MRRKTENSFIFNANERFIANISKNERKYLKKKTIKWKPPFGKVKFEVNRCLFFVFL